MEEKINNVLGGFYSVGEEFHNYNLDRLEELLEELFKRLKTYKDKEYKLRELVKENEIEKVNEYHKNTYTSCLVNGYKVLQILNEGSDK